MMETDFLTKEKTDTEIIKLPDNIQIPLTEGKFCTTCKIFKKLSEYFKNKNKPMGVECQCKDCRRIIKRNHYQNNKEKYKESFQKFILRNPNYFKK